MKNNLTYKINRS